MKSSLEEVIEFVRELSGDHKSVMTEHTLLDADLGITGDDVVELLEDAEKKFGVLFVTEERSIQETFGLGDNEYLFNSEGLDLLGIGRLVSWLRKEPRPVVRDLNLVELWRVLGMVKR